MDCRRNYLVLIAAERSDSPATRDLVHTLTLALLLLYFAFSAISILIAFGYCIVKIN